MMLVAVGDRRRADSPYDEKTYRQFDTDCRPTAYTLEADGQASGKNKDMKHTEFALVTKQIEGLTLLTVISFLAPYTLNEEHLRQTLAMLTFGGGIGYFDLVTPVVEDAREKAALLVYGRERALIRQKSDSSAALHTEKHLTFFRKAGFAPPTILQVTVSDPALSLIYQAQLKRDEHYRYWLNGQWIHVLHEVGDAVCLEVFDPDASKRSRVYISGYVFWSFVFEYGSACDHATIGTGHAAALLSINRDMTLMKHIDLGNLPVSDTTVAYPSITLTGLREFLAYRQQFPQGHSNRNVVEKWRARWRKANLSSYSSIDNT